jgi:HEAT repeat protein
MRSAASSIARRAALILLPAFLTILTAHGTALAVTEAQRDSLSANVSRALLEMGLTPHDCRIRSDYVSPDPFRLPLIDSLMYEPTMLEPRIDAVAARIERDSSLAGIASELWHAMSVEATMPGMPGGRTRIFQGKRIPWIQARLAAGQAERQRALPGRRIRNVRGNFAHLPPDLTHAIARYLDRLDLLTRLRDIAVERDSPYVDYLCANAASLVTAAQNYENLSPFTLDSLERAETARGDSVLRTSEKIEIRAVASMSITALEAADRLGRYVGRLDGIGKAPGWSRVKRYNGCKVPFGGRNSIVTGRILFACATDWGPIVVGDSLENTYEGSFALILDLGGNDTYNLASNPAIEFSLIVDRNGDDSYAARDSAALAGAIFGTSTVIDLAGNDLYRAGDLSLGAGIFGCGAILDRAGDDVYDSGSFSQGAGFVGLGILCDNAGRDSYTAAMQSQAFGYVGGAGLILERSGNDTYFTKPAQTDILRYEDHYLTLSQGCAFGYRPDYSGGIGLLVESGGNDLYSSDIFGQGVGYWFCVGAIIDRGGHDCYRSYQYAQGAGIHLAFGLLSDESGDDYYISKGVSQGCGHDLSLGLLADFSGNDCYTAVDLSQGAGSANGTGILYDADGIDAYSSKSKVNVNGYGDYRREFGSIGVQLDMAGADFYSARGENDALWEGGRYGLGMDVPGETSKPRGDIAVKEWPFEERPFTTEELYILAVRGEPRFQAWKKYAFDRMVADSAASIAYLRTVLDTKDATKRHAIKDILVAIGAPAVPMLSAEARGGDDLSRAEASWILGLIGDAGAFDALMELTRSEDWKLRSSALDALARLKGLSADSEQALRGRVAEVLEDEGEILYVRKDAVFVAGNRRYCDLCPLLADCLTDAHYSVRFASAEALRRLSGNAQAGTLPVAGASACNEVSEVLQARMPSFSAIVLVAALYAAGDLPACEKLDVVESALRTTHSAETEVAVAAAEICRSLEPPTEAARKRLDKIKAKLSVQSWEARSALEGGTP